MSGILNRNDRGQGILVSAIVPNENRITRLRKRGDFEVHYS